MFIYYYQQGYKLRVVNVLVAARAIFDEPMLEGVYEDGGPDAVLAVIDRRQRKNRAGSVAPPPFPGGSKPSSGGVRVT